MSREGLYYKTHLTICKNGPISNIILSDWFCVFIEGESEQFSFSCSAILLRHKDSIPNQ